MHHHSYLPFLIILFYICKTKVGMTFQSFLPVNCVIPFFLENYYFLFTEYTHPRTKITNKTLRRFSMEILMYIAFLGYCTLASSLLKHHYRITIKSLENKSTRVKVIGTRICRITFFSASLILLLLKNITHIDFSCPKVS